MKRGRPKEFIFSGKARDILLSLYENPKYFAELLRELGGSPASISVNLEELKKEGLVEDKYDKRGRFLNISEKGVEAVKCIKLIEDFLKKPEIEEIEKIPINRKKWILSLLYIAGEIKGITRLVKYLFLMKKEEEFSIDNGYNFIPYNYGPYSFEVYEDLEELERMGLIEIDKEILEPKEAGDWQILKKYKLTEKGKEIAEKIYNELDDVTKVKINELVERFGKYTLMGLLNYIYKRYPEECKKGEE